MESPGQVRGLFQSLHFPLAEHISHYCHLHRNLPLWTVTGLSPLGLAQGTDNKCYMNG